jgi:hypothetical protein
VVADAVAVEPVSSAKFPANREINREFRRIRLLGAILKADMRANSDACNKIPYSTEQGIFAKEQGICTREQGIERAEVQSEFLDPPYNVRVRDIGGRGEVKHQEFAMASGEMSQSVFTSFLSDTLALAGTSLN